MKTEIILILVIIFLLLRNCLTNKNENFTKFSTDYLIYPDCEENTYNNSYCHNSTRRKLFSNQKVKYKMVNNENCGYGAVCKNKIETFTNCNCCKSCSCNSDNNCNSSTCINKNKIERFANKNSEEKEICEQNDLNFTKYCNKGIGNNYNSDSNNLKSPYKARLKDSFNECKKMCLDNNQCGGFTHKDSNCWFKKNIKYTSRNIKDLNGYDIMIKKSSDKIKDSSVSFCKDININTNNKCKNLCKSELKKEGQTYLSHDFSCVPDKDCQCRCNPEQKSLFNPNFGKDQIYCKKKSDEKFKKKIGGFSIKKLRQMRYKARKKQDKKMLNAAVFGLNKKKKS